VSEAYHAHLNILWIDLIAPQVPPTRSALAKTPKTHFIRPNDYRGLSRYNYKVAVLTGAGYSTGPQAAPGCYRSKRQQVDDQVKRIRYLSRTLSIPQYFEIPRCVVIITTDIEAQVATGPSSQHIRFPLALAPQVAPHYAADRDPPS